MTRLIRMLPPWPVRESWQHFWCKPRVLQRFSTGTKFTRSSSACSCLDIQYARMMSFNEDRVPSSIAHALYCSSERYRQCSPESLPGLTAQCTNRCVVVTCSDPHDEDWHEGVFGDNFPILLEVIYHRNQLGRFACLDFQICARAHE